MRGTGKYKVLKNEECTQRVWRTSSSSLDSETSTIFPSSPPSPVLTSCSRLFSRNSSMPTTTSASLNKSSTPSKSASMWVLCTRATKNETKSRGGIKINKESEKLPRKRSTSAIEEGLSICAQTFLASSGIYPEPPIPQDPQNVDGLRRQYKNLLKLELISIVGPTRGNNLIKRHAEKSHFLLINADQRPDIEASSEIRSLLQDHPNSPTIRGQWNVPLGENRLNCWQLLIERSTVILVILSRALCEDPLLSVFFPEAIIREQAIVPIFLESFTDEEIKRLFPPPLRPINTRSGIILYDEDINYVNRIRELHNSVNYKEHLRSEITSLEDLVRNGHDACPCGNC